MAPVGRCIEDHIVWTTLNPAFQHCFEGFVACLVLVKGQVITEHNRLAACALQKRHEGGQAFHIFPVDFDEHERARVLMIDGAVHRLDQRALSHASGTPKKRIVGWKALGKPLCVFQELVSLAIHSLEETDINARDGLDWAQSCVVGLPKISVSGAQISRNLWCRRKAL